MRLHTKILATAAATAAVAAGGLSAAAPAEATTYGCTPITGGSAYLSAWGDNNTYVPATGGSFSSSPSPWQLTGASVVSDMNSTRNVTGDPGTGALAIKTFGKAVSPSMCVKWQDDRIRFFYKAPVGTTFRVATTGSSAWGSYTVNTWVTSYSTGWQLSPAILIPDWTDASDTQQLKITFSNPIGSTVLVDDVLVDPWKWTTW